MTTRIEGNQGAAGATQIDRVDSGRVADRGGRSAHTAQSDRVEVSHGATFVNKAVQAAHDAPAMREDKVLQAKKALSDGTLGQDAGKLADSIIDRLLDDTK